MPANIRMHWWKSAGYKLQQQNTVSMEAGRLTTGGARGHRTLLYMFHAYLLDATAGWESRNDCLIELLGQQYLKWLVLSVSTAGWYTEVISQECPGHWGSVEIMIHEREKNDWLFEGTNKYKGEMIGEKGETNNGHCKIL